MIQKSLNGFIIHSDHVAIKSATIIQDFWHIFILRRTNNLTFYAAATIQWSVRYFLVTRSDYSALKSEFLVKKILELTTQINKFVQFVAASRIQRSGIYFPKSYKIAKLSSILHFHLCSLNCLLMIMYSKYPILNLVNMIFSTTINSATKLLLLFILVLINLTSLNLCSL